MKSRFLFLCLFTILLVITGFSNPVGQDEARRVATNFYYERVNQFNSTPYRSIHVAETFPVISDGLTLYYVFNMEPAGFVMVSANDGAIPVLAYSFNSKYYHENQPPNFRDYIQYYKDALREVITKQLPADQDIQAAWLHYSAMDVNNLDIFSGKAVEPLISSIWDQDFPYNSFCPADPAASGSYNGHCPVGCTATSMSQIMHYWRHPHQGQGAHGYGSPYGYLFADFGATTYDWDAMSNDEKLEDDAIATLASHCGISVNMNYGPNGSGAQVSTAASALKSYFKYASSTQFVTRLGYPNNNTWANLMKTSIDAGRPVQYAGFPQSGPGHAFVCDGYQGNGAYTDYFHFNFGWEGAFNGYYLLSNINPGGENFNFGQQAVINIVPDGATYPYFCTGNTVLENTDGTLDDGSGPVDPYQSNANCSWLISPNDLVSKITLHFVYFDTEANQDILTIYDGENSSAPVLGTFSGTSIPADVVSTGDKLYITFVTNGSNNGKGWLMEYQATVTPYCISSTTLTDESGSFDDGSIGYQYHNQTLCKWFIKPTNAKTVTLTFSDFSTELTNDIITVYDLVTSTVLGTFSGSSIPDPVTSENGKMLLVFQTNKTIRGEGWTASYTITVGQEENQLNNSFYLYPNPVDEELHFGFELKQAGHIDINLVSAQGKVVYSQQLNGFSGSLDRTLDVTGYPQGVYILRIRSDHGVINKKVIIR